MDNESQVNSIGIQICKGEQNKWKYIEVDIDFVDHNQQTNINLSNRYLAEAF